jgi:deoxycytidine triphosphate deaminase
VYLSNRDIRWAIQSGKLIVDPPPESFGCGYDETSIDLHQDDIEHAKVWDTAKLCAQNRMSGPAEPVLYLGEFEWDDLAGTFLVPVPEEPADPDTRTRTQVYRKGADIIVKPGGFLLWTTKEVVGTPQANPELIAFVNAKSTRARHGHSGSFHRADHSLGLEREDHPGNRQPRAVHFRAAPQGCDRTVDGRHDQ